MVTSCGRGRWCKSLTIEYAIGPIAVLAIAGIPYTAVCLMIFWINDVVCDALTFYRITGSSAEHGSRTLMPVSPGFHRLVSRVALYGARWPFQNVVTRSLCADALATTFLTIRIAPFLLTPENWAISSETTKPTTKLVGPTLAKTSPAIISLRRAHLRDTM